MSAARLLGRRPHDPLEFAGRVELLHVASEVLADNPLGDPSVLTEIDFVMKAGRVVRGR